MRLKNIVVCFSFLVFAGCLESDERPRAPEDTTGEVPDEPPTEPPEDPVPPVVDDANLEATILFPPARSASDRDTIRVRGTSSSLDDDVVTQIVVNGVAAESTDGFATWSVDVPLAAGDNEIEVAIVDDRGERNDAAAFAVVEFRYPFRWPADMTFDSERDRVLILDAEYLNVWSINVATGAHELISHNDAPDSGVPLGQSFSISIDGARGRALVADPEQGIIAVDLDTGRRDVIAQRAATCDTCLLDMPAAADVLDDELFVLDYGVGGIVRVDLLSGEQSIVSTNDSPGDGGFGAAWDLAVDPATGSLYVTDFNLAALLAVDRETGERTRVDTPGTFVSAMTLQLAGDGRALVYDYYSSGIMAVNLADGSVTKAHELEGGFFGTGPVNLNGLAVLGDGDFAIINDWDLSVVDGNTGEQRLVADESVPYALGTAKGAVSGLSFDSASDRLLWADFFELVTFDVGQGTVSKIPRPVAEDEAFSSPTAVCLSADGAVAYVADIGNRRIMSVDMTTGARDVLAQSVLTVDMVNDGDRLIWSDPRTDELLSASIAEGDISTLSSPTVPDDVNAFEGPASMALDAEGGRLFVEVQSGTGIPDDSILAIDAATGARTLVAGPVPGVGALLYDATGDRLLVSGQSEGLARYRSINLANGVVEPLFDPDTIGDGVGPTIDMATGMAHDARRGIVYVSTQSSFGYRYRARVLAIDLANGHRVTLKR